LKLKFTSFFFTIEIQIPRSHDLKTKYLPFTKKATASTPPVPSYTRHVNTMPLFNTLSPNTWDYKEPRKGSNGAYNSYIDVAKGVRQTPRAQLTEWV